MSLSEIKGAGVNGISVADIIAHRAKQDNKIRLQGLTITSKPKTKRRFLRQLNKRLLHSSGAKRSLLKIMIADLKNSMKKIRNSSFSGTHMLKRSNSRAWRQFDKCEREIFLSVMIPQAVNKPTAATE